MNRRSELVRDFRALVDGKSKLSWASVIGKAERNIGLLSADDSHSILVSIAKSLKAPKKQVHPVKIAPLSLDLIKHIIHSTAPFRTKANTFGFVSRLGIDWGRHLPSDHRDRVCSEFRDLFKVLCEAELSTLIDAQTIGYCAETALFLNVMSEEMTTIFERKILLESSTIPPLALVQISQYLSFAESQRNVWRAIASRIARDISSFTAQNLVSLLMSFLTSGKTSSELIEKVCVALPAISNTMVVSDCALALECVSLLASDAVCAEKLLFFSKAMQRRLTLQIVSNPSAILPSDIARILVSMQRLESPPTSILMPLISDNLNFRQIA